MRRAPQRFCGPFHIRSRGATERGYRDLATFGGDRLDRREVAFGSDRKAGLNNVDTQRFQFTGNLYLFGRGQLAARYLLAIAKRGIKNINAVGIV